MEHRKILQHWPTTVLLADELGLTVSVVQKWKDRNHIPSKQWKNIIALWDKRRTKLDTEAKKKITLDDFV